MKARLILLSLMLLSIRLLSQTTVPLYPDGLPHTMTAEEVNRRSEIGRDFNPTDPPLAPVRMVAEFEEMQAVLIRYPFGIPMSLIQEMADDCVVITIVANGAEQNQVIQQYENAGVNLGNCEFLLAPTDSYWTRDYGPWFVVDGNNEVGICDFPYNRPRPYDDNIPVVLAGYLDVPLYGMDLIHTGGNFMCDGLGLGSSTDLLLEENPALTEEDIDTIVSHYLGLRKYNLLPDPLGDYIEHIDCWGKYLDVDKVLIGQVPPSDPRYDDYEYVANYFGFQVSSWGTPFQVYRVYTPGTGSGTPYTNSLVLNNKVFVPITGSQWDDEALAVYEEAMPGYEIHGIYYSTWQNTDALHCRAIGIADLGMLFVEHTPLLGVQDFSMEWSIDADIVPYSGAGLVSDSLRCYYKVGGGGFQWVPLIHDAGQGYHATIPFVEPGSQVSYYLQARDYSGRKKYHPYIGAPDPHTFTVDYAEAFIIQPDTLTYLTFDDMYLGKSFSIINYTGLDAIVQDVEHESLDGPIPFYIEPWEDDPPFSIGHMDTLSFTVKIPIPVENLIPGTILTDTMDIQTQYGLEQVIIRIDSDLLSGIGQFAGPGPEVAVYPNPVAGTSSIIFSLPEASRARIEVADLQGKKVATLADRVFPKGQNTIALKEEALPGGVYILRVITVEGVATLKIVLL